LQIAEKKGMIGMDKYGWQEALPLMRILQQHSLTTERGHYGI
jgi:hypothetical protein